MPSMFVPNHDHKVMIFPKTAMTIMPHSFTITPKRAWRMIAFQITMSNAPFSLGSQPQKRPHDWSAQMPPNTVPTKLWKSKPSEGRDARDMFEAM